MVNNTRLLTTLQKGGLIAYPTEAVYGLGCDPFNETAVMKILTLKQRRLQQGLILIASDWQWIAPLIQPLPANIERTVRASWPGPMTWLIPASPAAPPWIIGEHTSIAVRITQHPLARRICEQWQNPLVSTSANTSGQPPLTTAAQVIQCFGSAIDYVIEGEVGELTQPTSIVDALTNTQIR
ncbi:MAG: threonylcarbamoyl-AMP synthase [Legionellales bacterium]|nr:threonylcarbamoyl-AMP synthase [Legionellales bacterium]